MKTWIWVVLAVVVIGGGAYWWMQQSQSAQVPATTQTNNNSAQPTQTSTESIHPKVAGSNTYVEFDQSSLVTSSLSPTITGTAKGYSSLNLKVRTQGKSDAVVLGQVNSIAVNNGHWSTALTGIQGLQSGTTYVVCLTASNASGEYCDGLTIR